MDTSCSPIMDSVMVAEAAKATRKALAEAAKAAVLALSEAAQVSRI
jgi:hypothetical protein